MVHDLEAALHDSPVRLRGLALFGDRYPRVDGIADLDRRRELEAVEAEEEAAPMVDEQSAEEEPVAEAEPVEAEEPVEAGEPEATEETAESEEEKKGS